MNSKSICIHITMLSAHRIESGYLAHFVIYHTFSSAYFFLVSDSSLHFLSGEHTPIKWKVGGVDYWSCSFSAWHVPYACIGARSLDGLVFTLSCYRTAPWLGPPVLCINSSFKRNLDTFRERGRDTLHGKNWVPWSGQSQMSQGLLRQLEVHAFS